MLYQYKREPLNNDEVDKLINSCDTSPGKFCHLAAFRCRVNIIRIC
ncbi:MAG: hypothetical protein Q7J40_01125 [Atribacterota bacterium]|nr:hypothetical protein [Atribacterota bacterium]